MTDIACSVSRKAASARTGGKRTGCMDIKLDFLYQECYTYIGFFYMAVLCGLYDEQNHTDVHRGMNRISRRKKE